MSGSPWEISTAATLRRVLDALEPVLVLDPQRDGSGHVIGFGCAYANRVARSLASQLVESGPTEPPSGAQELINFCRSVVESPRAATLELRLEAGSLRGWYEIHATVDHGLVIAHLHNTSHRHIGANLGDALSGDGSLGGDPFRLILENESDVVFQADGRGVVQWISPSITEMTGWRPDEVVGHHVEEFISPGDAQDLESAVASVLAGRSLAYDGRARQADGSWRWISVRARPLFDTDGIPNGAVVTARDVNDEVMTREALAQSEERFRLAMQSAPIGMAVVDLDRRFLQVNPALCAMVGQPAEWFAGRSLVDILAPADEEADLVARSKLLLGTEAAISFEQRFSRADGSEGWWNHSIGLVRDPHGTPQSYVSIFLDVTEARTSRENLSYQATHDALTHLVNRRDLYRQVENIRAYPRRTGTRMGVLYIDVDGLKKVNDAWGHAAGDQLLVQISRRVSAASRANDVVARIGGDEFVVLLGSLHGAEDARNVAAKILRSLDEPVIVEGLEIHATVSIGIALAGEDEDPDTTLRHADSALYRAKEAGRGRAEVYDPAID